MTFPYALQFSLFGLLSFSACVTRDVRVDDGGEATDSDGTSASSTASSDEGTTASDSDDSTGESDSTASTDGSGFVQADTPESPCGEYELCDIWNPDCPTGEKCSMRACGEGSYGWDAYVCVPILGDDEVGEPCQMLGEDASPFSGLDSCGDGAACFSIDEDTGEGICVAHCVGSPEAPTCAGPAECRLTSDAVPALCIPWCDPLIQDCSGSNSCIHNTGYGRGPTCVSDASSGMGPYGAPCQFFNACNPGLACIEAANVPAMECDGADYCCSPYCDVDAPNTCPGEDQVCVSIWAEGPPPAGFEHVGVCGVP